MKKKGKGNIRGFDSGWALWEHTLSERFKIDKKVYVSPINRMFRNVISVCYNKGFNQRLFIEKLKFEHDVNLSWDRVRELAGLGRWAGQNYKGFIYYEWLTAIAFFCGYSLEELMSIDIPLNETAKDNSINYWAGKGKGRRAGQPDLTRNSFPEALNYKVNRK